MLLFFLSLILAVVIMLVIATAERMLNGVKLVEAEDEGRKLYKFRFASAFAGVGRDGWIKGAVIGTVVGIVNFFASKIKEVIWLAPIFLAIVLGLMVYLMVWWHKDGTNVKEMICFIILAHLFYAVAKPVIIMMPILVKSVFWMSLFSLLPRILLILCIGFFIVDALFYYYENGEDEEKAKIAHIFAWVVKSLTLLAIILLLVFGVTWKAISSSSPGTPVKDTPIKTNISWYGFYNLSLQNDSDPSNDFNFGFNPFKDEMTAKDYDVEFRERLKVDVALGAADMAWLDANVGTRFMGVFYDEVDQKWDAAINYAKERFMGDQILYYKTLDALFAFLDTANKVEITNADGIDDQMYMNPYTVDGIPDVIVMETEDHTGHFLKYTFIIKDQIFEVSYRIDCGYQPCDVADIMNITPQERPNSTPISTTPETTRAPETTRTPETNPPETNPPETNPPETNPPETNPPETTSPRKDPTQGTPVGGNDNPGPGPNTKDRKSVV